MLSYFIYRKEVDRNPTNGFKDINSKAFPLYKSENVNDVLYKEVENNLFIKVKCSTEMKKAVVYTVRLVFNSSHDIVFATCACVAGCGPTAVCKHIGAVCYLIEEGCHTTIEYTSCTSTLQLWRQLSQRKHDPCPLCETKFVRGVW